MSTCGEIRQKAWKTMTNRWTFRLLVAGVALSAAYAVVNKLLMTAFASLGITTLGDYIVRCLQAKENGMAYDLPTLNAWLWMAGGEIFGLFIWFIFFGIISFGMLRTCFKAADDDARRWFADAFVGFARPLELAWLAFCQMFAFAFCFFLGAVACALWLALVFWAAGALGEPLGKIVEALGYAVALGIVLVFWIWATYRYRLAWYLKVEHPDWSAIACVVNGRRLIAGYKWKSFVLDCSFAGWLALAFAAIIGVSVLFPFVKMMDLATTFGSVVLMAFLLLAFLGSYYALVRLGMTIVVARILLFREILAEKPL